MDCGVATCWAVICRRFLHLIWALASQKYEYFLSKLSALQMSILTCTSSPEPSFLLGCKAPQSARSPEITPSLSLEPEHRQELTCSPHDPGHFVQ